MPIKYNKSRRQNASFFLGFMLVCSVLLAILQGYNYTGYATAIDNNNFSNLPVMAELFANLLILFNLLIRLITCIVFIQWFRRAYFNLHQLGFKYLEYKEGWAAGGWFVPIASLVIPYRIMMELWENLHVHFKKDENSSHRSMIHLWWALFISSNILSAIIERAFDESYWDMRNMYLCYTITLIIDVIALALIMKTISYLGPLEDELMASAAAAPQETLPPIAAGEYTNEKIIT